MDYNGIGMFISFTLLYISELMPFLPTEAQGIIHGIFQVLGVVNVPKLEL